MLADAGHRQHHLSARSDWTAFFAAAVDDALFAEMARLVDLLADDVVVVLVTARPTTIRAVTLDWLARHEVRWDLLVMRAGHDYRPARVVKREVVGLLRAVDFDLRLAIDDDHRNVAMFEAEDVPCVELDRGYHR